MPRLLLIVEGEGDVYAAPVLLRRVLNQYFERYDFEIVTHRRHDLSHLRANDWANFKRYLEAAHAENCPIIWMLDCDDGCALEWLKQIYKLVALMKLRQPLAFVFWVREYEVIFIYDLEAIKVKLNIQEIHDVPEKPEAKRGVKEWICDQLPRGFSYRETIDQEAITAVVDLGKIFAKSGDFEHLVKVVSWMINDPKPEIYPSRF